MNYISRITTFAFLIFYGIVCANTSAPSDFTSGFNNSQHEVSSQDAPAPPIFESGFDEGQNSESLWTDKTTPEISVLARPGSGGGVVGPGQAVPIDTHVYALMIIALLFIVFYTRQTTAQKAN